MDVKDVILESSFYRFKEELDRDLEVSEVIMLVNSADALRKRNSKLRHEQKQKHPIIETHENQDVRDDDGYLSPTFSAYMISPNDSLWTPEAIQQTETNEYSAESLNLSQINLGQMGPPPSTPVPRHSKTYSTNTGYKDLLQESSPLLATPETPSIVGSNIQRFTTPILNQGSRREQEEESFLDLEDDEDLRRSSNISNSLLRKTLSFSRLSSSKNIPLASPFKRKTSSIDISTISAPLETNPLLSNSPLRGSPGRRHTSLINAPDYRMESQDSPFGNVQQQQTNIQNTTSSSLGSPITYQDDTFQSPSRRARNPQK
ncbi:hypothetical protein CANARDRAFT_28052 [[Candida] arabinofermentans NRRL YB-2248]|uniref:Uncharacterized protein n=1 Tax=[Candida] arabinofermentans NRRL YB-2248 TaxID=983967 RepID=A0A1E4T2M4_9ASCO|nr:hypothetical protein CANARDRAFT_28052 [[Candida] arabinofermentans NRRL YB-2248]